MFVYHYPIHTVTNHDPGFIH